MIERTERVAFLELEIRRHRELYYNASKPEIADDAFDALLDELKALAPDSPVHAEVGAPVKVSRESSSEKRLCATCCLWYDRFDRTYHFCSPKCEQLFAEGIMRTTPLTTPHTLFPTKRYSP